MMRDYMANYGLSPDELDHKVEAEVNPPDEGAVWDCHKCGLENRRWAAKCARCAGSEAPIRFDGAGADAVAWARTPASASDYERGAADERKKIAAERAARRERIDAWLASWIPGGWDTVNRKRALSRTQAQDGVALNEIVADAYERGVADERARIKELIGDGVERPGCGGCGDKRAALDVVTGICGRCSDSNRERNRCDGCGGDNPVSGFGVCASCRLEWIESQA